jgi:nicotinamide-nucleotide amidase
MADALGTLANLIAARLGSRGLTLATAESCTGGMISAALTDIAGSSAWFDCGFVTYSNAAKRAMLGIDAALIERHGAVSEEVAKAMASGAILASSASLALAVTGIAGPGGAVPGKPVGMVCFAWSEREGPTKSETVHFQGDRAAVRRAACLHALRGIVDWLDMSQGGEREL